ncbi:MAG: phenylacetate--CoA ligase family protein [Kiloniellaceae bacterium]
MTPPPPLYRPLQSAHASVVWPALPTPEAARMAAILLQFEDSQWWTPEAMLVQQLRQADALLQHAYRQLPFYRDRLAEAGYLPGKALTPEVWARIPLLTRADLQQAGAALFSPEIPKGHGGTYEISTSGSTGRPIKAKGTAMVQVMWRALTLREHLWHRRDFGGTLAGIRSLPNDAAPYPKGARSPLWGAATKGIYKTGPSATLSIVSRTEEQAEWLQRVRPDYLLTYPSALRDLLLYCRDAGIVLPRLREVRTLSELLPAETRRLCREVWGLGIVDMYSTQEAGYLALQCPVEEHYHLQSEVTLVEVLNAAGEACRPGEVGEVVVTSLINFAMPMIRYAVGDLAEVGEPCACGRGLPVLKRILGRVRDMLVYPDGRRAWPLLGDMFYTEIPEIRQFQMVQHAVDDIEIKVVAERPLTAAEEDRLRGWLHHRSGHAFPVRITYHREIPRSAGGKFQDFRSEMAPPPDGPDARQGID